MIALVLTTAAVFTVAVFAHLALTHVRHNHRYVLTAFGLFGVVCVLALPLALRFGWLGAAVMYAALVILWNSYLVFFINLMNSVSLRIVSEIERSPTKAMTLTEVHNVYSDEEALEARLEALIRNGLLVDEGGAGLVLAGRGTRLARFLEGARKVFGIDSFG